MKRLVCVALAVTLATTSSPGAAEVARAFGARQPAPVNAAIEQAFRAVYNLDYDEAMAQARRAVAIGPNESQAHRTLAAVIWLRLLFRRGAVSIDFYLGSLARQKASAAKADPELVAEFKTVLARAIELAESRLTQNPKDLQARFDVGAVYALQASYTASVEFSMTSAFRSARRAFDEQEEVLARDPNRVGAGLVVGLYRYLISVLSLPTRLFAYVAGFGGGKEKGIQMLEAAVRAPETRTDAKTALMLVYSREGRHSEVITLARELRTEFPRNRLFLLEEGAAAIRAGRAAEAEAVLTQGIGALDTDTRPKVPGERAYWHYKRGLARVLLRNLDAARTDLHTAQQSLPIGWVNGRINLELGKIADLSGRRPEAVTSYRTAKSICDANDDTVCSAEASRLQRRPYRSVTHGKTQDLALDHRHLPRRVRRRVDGGRRRRRLLRRQAHRDGIVDDHRRQTIVRRRARDLQGTEAAVRGGHVRTREGRSAARRDSVLGCAAADPVDPGVGSGRGTAGQDFRPVLAAEARQAQSGFRERRRRL